MQIIGEPFPKKLHDKGPNRPECRKVRFEDDVERAKSSLPTKRALHSPNPPRGILKSHEQQALHKDVDGLQQTQAGSDPSPPPVPRDPYQSTDPKDPSQRRSRTPSPTLGPRDPYQSTDPKDPSQRRSRTPSPTQYPTDRRQNQTHHKSGSSPHSPPQGPMDRRQLQTRHEKVSQPPQGILPRLLHKLVNRYQNLNRREMRVVRIYSA